MEKLVKQKKLKRKNSSTEKSVKQSLNRKHWLNGKQVSMENLVNRKISLNGQKIC